MYQFVKKNPTQIYKNLKPTNENLTEICKIIPVQVKIKSVIENWPLNIYIYIKIEAAIDEKKTLCFYSDTNGYRG